EPASGGGGCRVVGRHVLRGRRERDPGRTAERAGEGASENPLQGCGSISDDHACQRRLRGSSFRRASARDYARSGSGLLSGRSGIRRRMDSVSVGAFRGSVKRVVGPAVMAFALTVASSILLSSFGSPAGAGAASGAEWRGAGVGVGVVVWGVW